MVKKVFTILLLFLICFRVGWMFYQHKDTYALDYWTRYESLKEMFGASQYSMKEWKYWLPDETVYAYAGGAYLKGANPTLVESTQPPLGKYLIGLSIFLTGNENIIVSVFFALLFFGIYILIWMMTKNSPVALLGVFVALHEPLFMDQLTYTPLLDMFHITFILYAIIFASYAIQKSKPMCIVLSFLFLTASMMTKVWVMGFVYMVAITLYIVLKKPKYYGYIIFGGIVLFFGTLAAYSRLLFDKYSVMEILKVQKWLYWYHNSKMNRFGTIWPLIFLNKWYVWWGNSPVIKDAHWSLTWPVVVGSGIVSSIYTVWSMIKKTEPALQISAIAIITYAVFMSLGQANARYLLPFLPICYSMMIWAAFSVAKPGIQKRHRRKRI